MQKRGTYVEPLDSVKSTSTSYAIWLQNQTSSRQEKYPNAVLAPQALFSSSPQTSFLFLDTNAPFANVSRKGGGRERERRSCTNASLHNEQPNNQKSSKLIPPRITPTSQIDKQKRCVYTSLKQSPTAVLNSPSSMRRSKHAQRRTA